MVGNKLAGDTLVYDIHTEAPSLYLCWTFEWFASSYRFVEIKKICDLQRRTLKTAPMDGRPGLNSTSCLLQLRKFITYTRVEVEKRVYIHTQQPRYFSGHYIATLHFTD